MSPGRWHQRESGWQKNKGVLIPIGTTAATIAAAARAVEWDAGEALRTAGFTSDDVPRPIPTAGLDRFSDDELLAEVRKRMRSAAHAAPSSSPAAPPAPGLRVVDGEKDALDEAASGEDDAPPAEALADAARPTPADHLKGRAIDGTAPDGGA